MMYVYSVMYLYLIVDSSQTVIPNNKTSHSHLENKVTCRKYKVGEKGGKGFGCSSKKKKNACYFLGVGSKQGRLDLILPKF